ncbi:MAG TPA: relaxase/mobilization nuclease domain-containing protein [Puia sp.]|jgi:hypothetical protein
MLAKIEFPKNIVIALRYNEEKLTEGKAESIWAENFLKNHDRLSMKDKIDRFHQRSSLNEKWVDNGLHISLNFGKTEILENEKMKEIANSYMSSMGFADQPYVVYRHNDAGHTHLHLVTTSIRSDGSKIHLRLKHLAESHEICKRIEREYSLQRNVKTGPEEKARFEVEQAQKVVYGEPGFKRAINDVLNTVVDHYKYTSLEELNAVLRLYNVEANPGTENSRLRKVGGLIYHGLDEDGKRIGMPIKASGFLLKPTLNRLKERFSLNRELREDSADRVKTSIEWSFAGEVPDWKGLLEDLERQGITVVVTESRNGSAGNLFFVDHIGKSVFAGVVLSEDYSLLELQKRCVQEEIQDIQEIQKQHLNLHL